MKVKVYQLESNGSTLSDVELGNVIGTLKSELSDNEDDECAFYTLSTVMMELNEYEALGEFDGF